MKVNFRFRIRSAIAAMFLTVCASTALYAEENRVNYLPTRYGMALTAGRTFNPASKMDFYMVSGFLLFDYDRIWKHRTPEQLRFKLEGTMGAAHEAETRLVTSVNMFALYYLDRLRTGTFRPYIEGGIGIVYTDFQIRGQGLRVNFNPQMGLGTEIVTGSNDSFFLAARLHHISNAGLDDQNRGINSVMFMFGFYF